MNENRITKREVLNAIKELATNGTITEVGNVKAEDIVAYVDTTIEQLDAKAKNAKKYAAKKKEANNELRDAVQAVLTDDYQTLAEITDAVAVEGASVTPAKIAYRLRELIDAGLANKTDVKVEGRTIKAYAAGPAPVDEDEAE